MTFREKIAEEYPNALNEVVHGGVCSCPYSYGYETGVPDFCPGKTGKSLCDPVCRACWDREMPELGTMTLPPVDSNVMRVVLDDGAFEPTRAHDTDAGLDLRSRDNILIPAHGSACFNTGVHVAFPHGYYGKLESKSGLNVKHGIVSLGGVIDENYTGSIIAKLYNMTDEDYQVYRGDKIVQMVITAYATPKIVVVDELDATDRGENGFGSTGR